MIPFSLRGDDQNPLWEKFAVVFSDDPTLWTLMKKYTFEAIAAGRRDYSARTIFHRIRWHVHVQTGDPEFKINDHWTPYYSRVFMWAHPQHAPSCWRDGRQCPWGVRAPTVNDGFFELREVGTNFEIEEAIYTQVGSK